MEKKKVSIGIMNGSRTRTVQTRRKISATASVAGSADAVMRFQNISGNQAVQQWIKSGTLQAKLTIGPPNDIYEQQADRVADQVMCMADTSIDAVQRKPG